MPIDAKAVCLFIPAGLRAFKLNLFERIGQKVGRVIRHDVAQLDKLPNDIVPIIGCMPEVRPLIDKWLASKRTFIYWDRGYARRIFATWLPRGANGGYYRWHLNAYQLRQVRNDLPRDRWDALDTELKPWQQNGKHIVIARPSDTYCRFHNLTNWLDKTVKELSLHTPRQLVVRDKETKRSLQDDIRGAHALVTHGSIAAVEAVIEGCPVFVDKTSAAVHVGRSDLALIEKPLYPDREHWLRSLAYSQFDENELVNGTLWRLIT